MIFGLVEQVVTDVDDRQFAVMWNCGKYVGTNTLTLSMRLSRIKSDGHFPSKIWSLGARSPLWKRTKDLYFLKTGWYSRNCRGCVWLAIRRRDRRAPSSIRSRNRVFPDCVILLIRNVDRCLKKIIFKKISFHCVNPTATPRLLAGLTYVRTPRSIAAKHAVVNVKNRDDRRHWIKRITKIRVNITC